MKDLLQNIDFFQGLDEKIMKKIAASAILRQYSAGETVVRQGETGLGLYVIVRGRVKVHKQQNGAEIDIAELGPQKFFAEMAIIDNKPRSASITTLEDTECLLLTRDSFIGLMKKYPEVPIRLARLLAERLRDSSEKLAQVTEKLAAAPGALPEALVPPADPAPRGEAPRAAAVPARLNGTRASTTATAASEVAAAPRHPRDTKSQIEEALVRSFDSLFTMKAITRFSVAIIGCPVVPRAPDCLAQFSIGHVKTLILPAERPVRIAIAAYDSGTMSIHVFRPGEIGPLHLGPLSVASDEHMDLHVDPGFVALERLGGLCRH